MLQELVPVGHHIEKDQIILEFNLEDNFCRSPNEKYLVEWCPGERGGQETVKWVPF